MKSKHSKKDLAELDSALRKLSQEGIVGDFNLEEGEITILSDYKLIKRMEKQVFTAFRIAFPDSIIRRQAVDLYLATLSNTYLKLGLGKEETLIAMMLSLEQENQHNFKLLAETLKKKFAHYNFEKIKLQ